MRLRYDKGYPYRDPKLGSSYIGYYPSGQVKVVEFRYGLGHLLHNTEGPAYISYDESGKVRRRVYALEGRRYLFRWVWKLRRVGI